MGQPVKRRPVFKTVHSMMSVAEVCTYCGISKSTLYNYRAHPEIFDAPFPQAVRFGPRKIAWNRKEVTNWLSAIAGVEKIPEEKMGSTGAAWPQALDVAVVKKTATTTPSSLSLSGQLIGIGRSEDGRIEAVIRRDDKSSLTISGLTADAAQRIAGCFMGRVAVSITGAAQ